MIKHEVECDLCGGPVTENHVDESIPIWEYGYSGKYCKVVAHVSLNQDHVCKSCSEHIIRSVGLNTERNIINSMHDLDSIGLHDPLRIAVRDSDPTYGITFDGGELQGWSRDIRNDSSPCLFGPWHRINNQTVRLSFDDLVACDWGTFLLDPEEDPVK